MLNFVAWVIAGGLLGGAVSWMVRGEAVPGLLLNVTAGVVAAFLAGLAGQGWLLFHHLTTSPFSLLALAAAALGAAAMLAIVNVRRGAQSPAQSESSPNDD